MFDEASFKETVSRLGKERLYQMWDILETQLVDEPESVLLKQKLEIIKVECQERNVYAGT